MEAFFGSVFFAKKRNSRRWVERCVCRNVVAAGMVGGVRMRDASFALQTVTSSPTTVKITSAVAITDGARCLFSGDHKGLPYMVWMWAFCGSRMDGYGFAVLRTATFPLVNR